MMKVSYKSSMANEIGAIEEAAYAMLKGNNMKKERSYSY
jgi:hypothetical protein